MIDYLYGSKSLGVRNYTHELKHHMSASGLDVNMRGVGGVHVLSKMEQSQLRIICSTVCLATIHQ